VENKSVKKVVVEKRSSLGRKRAGTFFLMREMVEKSKKPRVHRFLKQEKCVETERAGSKEAHCLVLLSFG